jgi:hypothetical protein
VEAKLEGKRLTIGVRDSLAALPVRDAYVFKIAGAR